MVEKKEVDGTLVVHNIKHEKNNNNNSNLNFGGKQLPRQRRRRKIPWER
jgi:hypothetical protein